MVTMQVSSAICFVLFVAQSVNSQLICDTNNGWENLQGSKCYKIFSDENRMTYERAAETCKQYSSRLVMIKDQEENDAVAKRVEQYNGRREGFFIGMSRTESDDCSLCKELIWSNGEEASEYYGFWSDLQPDDDEGDCVCVDENSEDYVYDRPHTWSFGSCLTKRSFVCERMASPQESFHCFSGGFVSLNKKCNGINDCIDQSDELDCPNLCRYYLSQSSGTLNQISFDNAQTCYWAIETPVGTNAYVQFTSFNTEYGADYVSIYVGHLIESKAMNVYRISGQQSTKQYRSSNNMLLIKFSSDAFVRSAGFQAVYGSFHTDTGLKTELVAYPDPRMYNLEPFNAAGYNSFLSDHDYVFVIKTSDTFMLGQMITLQIEELNIDKNDKLMFFDGDTPAAPLLATYCHSDDCTNYKTVYSTGHYMSVLLSTYRGMMNDVAFKFSYRQGCYFESTASYGTIFSPGFPENINYPDHISCVWMINVGQPFALHFDPATRLKDDLGLENNKDFLKMTIDNEDVLGVSNNEELITLDVRDKTFVADGSIGLVLSTSSILSARGFMATWSIHCQDPEYDSNTLVIAQQTSFYYTAKMEVTCPRGYDFHQEQIPSNVGTVNLECGYMGLWNYKQVPRCSRNYCGGVPDIANGYIESSTGSEYQDTATYKCFQGSTLQPVLGGDSTIECQDTGRWSPSPSCIARPCSNTIFASISNGQATGSGNTIGSIYRYECDPGYKIVGDPIIFCQENGTWTQDSEPTCELLQCHLPNVMNGRYIFLNAQEEFIVFGRVLNVECNGGYEQMGNASIECGADRMILGTPSCENINECGRGALCEMGCHDNDGSYTCSCPDGYELQQDGYRCRDIDECDLDIDNCDDDCFNNNGGYTCGCNFPYTLFNEDMVSGFRIPIERGESGLLPSDTYHINHTCVYVTCAEPPVVDNGMLLTKRLVHRFSDYIEYQCNIGFLPRRTTLQCGNTGQWIGTVPTCQVAQCNENIPNNLVNAASAVRGPYNYNYRLELNCTRADGLSKKYRYCTYNKEFDIYEMQGDSYECGEVDCGTPIQYSGTNNYIYQNTLYDGQFEFTCSQGGREGKTLANSSSTVKCLAEGYWDFGNLQCTGQSCLDPTSPAGGYQIATSYADNSEVNFGCSRAGYTLSSDVPLICDGTQFIGTVPECIDTAKPEIVNCPTSIGPVPRYALLADYLSPSTSPIYATDNTGVEQFFVTPRNANTTYNVENNLTVTYTAVDGAGNTQTCDIEVTVIDDVPPTIGCPQLRNVFLDNNDDEENLNLGLSDFLVNDNRNGFTFRIDNQPPNSYTRQQLYETYTYTALVEDNNRNTASCRGQVFVQPRACSDLSFLDPVYGYKDCVDIPGNIRQCEVYCNSGYHFEDGQARTIRCFTGNWDADWVPACVQDTLKPSVICPESRAIYSSVDSQFVDFTALPRTISDFSEIIEVSFSADNYTFDDNDLFKRVSIEMTATDAALNTQSCRFEYTLLPNEGTPMALTRTLFAETSCVRRTTFPEGYDCTITCNQGKILRNVGPSTIVSSTDGQPWAVSAHHSTCIDDTMPPEIVCPRSREVELSTGDQQLSITFNAVSGYTYEADDWSGISSATYSPPSVILTANDLYTSKTINLNVVDDAGNSKACSFQILVRARTCSELAIPSPVNGDKVCNTTGNILTCYFTCNNGYSFYQTQDSTYQTQCVSNNPFTSFVPDCVRDDLSVQKEYIVTLDYSYIPIDNSIQSIDSSCTQYYSSSSSSKFSSMASALRNLCSSVVDLGNMEIEFLTDSTSGNVINNVEVQMEFQFVMRFANLAEYEKCVDIFRPNINREDNIYELSKPIIGDGQNCPDLEWRLPDADITANDYYCFLPYVESLKDNNLCSLCPPGTEVNGNTCNVCGRGSFSDQNGGTCKLCSNGGTTHSPGATSSSQCVDPCGTGQVSQTGYAPCFPCAKGTYKTSSQACTSCSPGETTLTTASTSSDDCFSFSILNNEPCSIGTQNVGSSNECELCPVGTLRSSTNLQSCVSCPNSFQSTYIAGATSTSQCLDICTNGFISDSGLAHCEPCAKGTFQFNATYCQPCSGDFTTAGEGSASSSACVSPINFRVRCPKGTQRDQTTGECGKCPIGFYNQNEENICQPCPGIQSTYFEGATSQTMCRTKCVPGFFSSTGLSPCSPCGTSRFSTGYGSTTCESCGASQSTATTTSTSSLDCLDECPAGQFSYNGFYLSRNQGCSLCPPNYYQSSSGSTRCDRCPSSSTFSIINGLKSINECIVSDNDNDLCNGRCLEGTCSIIDNTPVCDCTDGQYFGDRCEQTVDLCLTNPCYNGGDCTPSPGGYTCDCRGLASGNNCENINPLCDVSQNPTCKNGGHCVNLLGRTECMCRSGFSGTFCLDNADICESSPCNATGTVFPNGCMDVSWDSNLRYRCNCKPGYTGQDCEIEIDECEYSPCINGGVCQDRINGFFCNCPPGYSGNQCQTRNNVCNVNCGNSDDTQAMCVDVHKIDRYMCLCNEGYSYDNEGFAEYHVRLNTAPEALSSTQSITGIDTNEECRDYCTGQLSCRAYSFTSLKCYIWNSIPSDEAMLTVNYHLYIKSVKYPDDDFWSMRYDLTSNSVLGMVIDLGTLGVEVCGGTEYLDTRCCRTGLECDVDNALCDFNVFLNNADYDIQFKCSVNRVFNQNRCTRKVDYCTDSPCQNGGVCENVFQGHRCNCPNGYTGLNCQTNINECAGNPCQFGTCTDEVGTYRCTCDYGYEGFNCNSPIDFCEPDTCNSQGRCFSINGVGFECSCFPGYTGARCEDQIQFCDSNPCIHGTCQHIFNGYQCECDNGWEGTNCDSVKNYCMFPQTGDRLCEATCQSIFQDYYCSCPANTYGRNCQNQPNPCINYNKCLNGGSCSYNNTMMCDCPAWYTGVGCQILVDHCGETNNCMHGSVCRLTETSYECICSEGYEGMNCETKINYCAGNPCPGRTCVNLRNGYECKCNLGRTGENCNREADFNYDLYFHHPYGYGFAWIPYYVEVDADGDGLSIVAWVRYATNGGTGVYMSIFNGDGLDDAMRLMEFHENGLTVYEQTSLPKTIPFTRNAVINDGNWHHIVVNHNFTTNVVTLHSDTVRGEVTQQLMLPTNPLKLWVVLGCEFENENHQCEKDGNNFHGYLSRVNFYSRELTFNGNPVGEISTNHAFHDSVFSDIILMWNGYQLETGVTQIFGSEAYSAPCSQQNRNPACNLYSAANLPSVSYCPGDIDVYSEDRTVTVSWNEPTFDNVVGGTVIGPRYSSSSTFAWGTYDITYVVVDGNDNRAYCSFKIYVRAFDCELPPAPFGGNQNCDVDSMSGRKGCSLTCPNSVSTDYITDRKKPNLFTCGPSGTWNYDKPFQKFRYPACGAVQQQSPSMRAYIRYTYNILSAACIAGKININSRILEELVKLNTLYRRPFCQQASCADVNITITCDYLLPNGRKKRQSNPQDYFVLVELAILGADPRTDITNDETISLYEFLVHHIVDNGVFNFGDSFSGANVEIPNLFIETASVCPTGQVLLQGFCVECGPGNYYTMDSKGVATCDDCPIGEYQTSAGQTSCNSCNQGFTTELPGNYEGSSCKRSCPRGEYFDNTANACLVCPIGYYQDEVGQFRCKFCGADFTTKNEGSISSNNCSTSCDHGYQLSGFGTCVPCPIGEYRNASNDRSCVPCRSGYITEGIASKSSDDCSIVACLSGSYRDIDQNDCLLCPLNSYQPNKWQTECITCGDESHWRTESTGSSNQTACKYYCPSGFEVASVGNCDICEIGAYKDNNEDIQGFCTPCTGNYRTPTEGSTLARNCSIYKCNVGYYPNQANDDCLPCPLGTYQDVPYSTECKICSSSTLSTRQVASNSSSQCETYCPSGEEKVGDNCVRCPVGKYKNNDNGLFGLCISCNPLFTTADDGSDEVSDCNIRTCPKGTKRNPDDTGCDACPIGTYQALAYQTSCELCPSSPEPTSTRTVNSTSLDDCETYCDSGYEKTGSICRPCDIGKYKDNNVDGLFASCMLCPTNRITDSIASTSESACDVANCSAGTYRDVDSETCTYCEIGFYQDKKWQTECIQCGPDKTTENQGSDSPLDCILECSPGYEDVGGRCQQCGIGYYKVESAAAACTKCGDGLITSGIGSTAESQCNIPACQPGEYLDRSVPSALICRPCGYDTYQNLKWQDSCIQCPSGRPVTLQMGSDENSDCVLDCASGTEYVVSSQSCQICPQGYYRNKNIRSQINCQMCPETLITVGQRATSINDCNIANCSSGTYRNTASNTCLNCPIGSYQNQKWQTSCIDCPAGNSTASTGSTLLADCESICPAGRYVSADNRCLPCPIGSYKSDVDAAKCTLCPSRLLTADVGSDDENDCSVSPCNPGEKYVLNSETCDKCEKGTYQPNSGRFSCIYCPGVRFTLNEGSTSPDQCRSSCEAGEQFIETTESCEDCPEGTYQPSQYQFECIPCPDNRKYSVRGATSQNQCYSYCSTQGNNDCSANATCTLSTSNSQGYTCSCFNGYDSIGSLPGRECQHTCDRGYCKNGATCNRGTQVSCSCSEWYTGNRCESRLRADDLSDDTMDIIIPAAIGGGGLLLLLIILVVCCLCWRNSRKTKSRPRQYSEFNGDRMDKVSVYSYGQPLYTQQPQMLMLAPSTDMVYDNQVVLSKDIDHASSINDSPAYYQA